MILSGENLTKPGFADRRQRWKIDGVPTCRAWKPSGPCIEKSNRISFHKTTRSIKEKYKGRGQNTNYKNTDTKSIRRVAGNNEGVHQ